MEPIKISTVICTRNRCNLLETAVKSLCEQTFPPNEFEIIVIDNGSSDPTQETVERLKNNFPFHKLSTYIEKNIGLSHARNLGLKYCRGDWIAYLDDDAQAETDWLGKAKSIINEVGGDIECLGGIISPYYTSPKPEWFKDAYETNTWGVKPRKLNFGESLNGSNMIWRTAVLRDIGGFSSDFGLKGDELNVGEETNAFHQVWREYKEPTFYYVPDLRVYHWVAPYKMKVAYRLKREFIKGQVGEKLKGRQPLRVRIKTIIAASLNIFSSLVKMLINFRSYSFWQNWIVEEGRNIMRKLGVITASFGISVKADQN